MQTHLVLTVIGRDRPGLVNAVSETVAAGGGNWLDTRMASLAGQFAGILLVEVARDKADALVAALKQLETQGLRVMIEKSEGGAPARARKLKLDLLGLDRPGIVREISRLLASRQVSIVELETEQVSGSFSGEAMFKARAELETPVGLDMNELRDALEGIASELMVDLNLADAA